MTRVGDRARWAAWGRLTRWVRSNVILMAQVIAIFASLLFFTDKLFEWMKIPHLSATRSLWFLAGALGGILVMSVFFQSGAFAISAGADAEGWTSKELRKLRKAGYRTIDNLEFAGFDVDHVVLGPAGAFAIETKWASAPWIVKSGHIEGPRRDPIVQTLEAARQIHLLMNLSLRKSIPVKPILVIWGPGQPRLKEATELRGVVVVPSALTTGLLRVLGEATISPEQSEDAFQALDDFARKRREHERKASGHRFSYRVTQALRMTAIGLILMVALTLLSVFRN